MSDRGSWNALLSHPASGAECEISGEGAGCEISGESGMSPGQNSRCEIPEEGETSQGGPSACARCRDPSPWWHGAYIAIRSNSIRIPQEDSWRALLSELPQGEAHDTRDHHTRTIAYPILICCPDHWLKCTSLATSFWQPATAHIPPPSDGVSGCSVWTSFAGKIDQNSIWVESVRIPYSLHSGFAYGKGLQSFDSSCFWAFHCLAMDSKELSSISDCFGDKKSYQNTKT